MNTLLKCNYLDSKKGVLYSRATKLYIRPKLGSISITNIDLREDRTAEIAANSPRYRRRSSTFIDGVHDVKDDKTQHMAPAQLYSTMSGRLFHSGRIAIVLVGLPARGKTHISVSLSRYLQWLGVKTRVFHLGDYRRATMGDGVDVPEDYFFINASAPSVMLRQKILKKCREDIYAWLNHENGQVAIYDAVNPLAGGRRSLAKEFAKHDVQTLFLESYVTDQRILEENARSVKISSPDFVDMNPDEAAKLYLRRIDMKIPHFETMTEDDLNFVKMINAGESIEYNNVSFGYLSHRIVFYLMNLHIKSRVTYFARAGTSNQDDLYKTDASLGDEGKFYAQKMMETLLAQRETERANQIAAGGADVPLKPLTVWTSTRRRTVETAEYFKEAGFRVRQRSQMSQINPGDCEKLSENAIRRMYPEEVGKHEMDPYHHRYPRAESYHDLAVRLEPIILELEREQNDLLIVAHESVLRVLYGYLMACDAMHIPTLKFPRNQIIEIIPASYQNEAKRIYVPDLNPSLIPGSPEDIRIPVAPSGIISPLPGAGTPAQGLGTPTAEKPDPLARVNSYENPLSKD
ncbi:related to 6-phosphofructo-2-kinase/fructose-2,6-bisphosphate 2-phosphatase [Rhynchosporium graminicola]|uniref:Related to 6-phosphofructo-2-kinase/fructose-2,6-bisphosphate 2-phosphatase n=2 Tax=Rhynchosporium TaxID=38037 RepID=A0A1E1MAZ4_RHYSE|nr:related to 6-phosphofructo-2-kinase/fructose-2,6-bisphosphate 2-phosphatase [Rhynchosporium commune]CZT46250.1 related to 6-phosphofructo-2-kinase/fructose-2,6-bisphosphate 2-phosphatase [Rhynchosporium secalis]